MNSNGKRFFNFSALNEQRRLSIMLVVLAVAPALAVGWISYSAIFDDVRSESLKTVEQVSSAKHDQLTMLLKRAGSRSRSTLLQVSEQCGSVHAGLNRACAANLIHSYLNSEGALGATLLGDGRSLLTVGTSAVRSNEDLKFKEGQVAQLARTGPDNMRVYFVAAAVPDTGLTLAVTYAAANLQPIFDRPQALGNSGETFLVDSEGYFVTPARYQSAQGHKHPISARPMQECLSGHNGNTMDLDYRDTKVIHGYRVVPEFGSACIMSHIDQGEAFAPLITLTDKAAAILAIFLLPVVLLALNIARRISNVEGALRASEKKFRFLFESANDSLIVMDTDGLIQDINHIGHARLGYSKKEMLGKTIMAFDDAAQAAHAPARIDEVRSKGVAVFESAHVRKDGTLMPVEVSAKVIEMDGQQKLFSIERDISERKKEQEQFRLVLRTSLDGFWITDEQGRFLDVNDAYCSLIGYSREDLLNMGIPDIEANEMPEDTAEHIRELMFVGSVRFETRHRCKDGSLLDIEVSATHNREHNRIYCFLHDITKRKRTEELLKLQRMHLESEVKRRTAALTEAKEALESSFHEIDDLYQNAPCGYHSVDQNGTIVRMNDTELKMLGYTRNEIIGRNVLEFLTPASQASFRGQFSHLKELGQLNNIEVEYVRKDGTTLPALINTSAVRDGDGNFVMSRATCVDITERKYTAKIQLRLNRALRLLSEGNAALIHAQDEQSLLDAICELVVNAGGYLMAWVGVPQNDLARSVLPVAKTATAATYLQGIHVSWADTKLGQGPTGKAIRTGHTQVNQDILYNQNMSPWRDASIMAGYRSSIALPIVGESKTHGALTIYAVESDAFVADEIRLLEELASNLAYGIDTLRMRELKNAADRELEAHRRNLEELIAQRTAELSFAKIEAERANNAKSRFLAAASHDLRQPLSALKLYLGVLKNKLSHEEKELLLNMQGCVAGLSDLLSKLLDLSKLEAGVVTPRVSDFDLDGMIAKVLAAHAPEAEAKGLRLRAGPSGMIARTDPVLFQRIIGNLVSNAVRYTEHGGVLIGCRRRAGKTWVEVWDTGIGIPPDKTDEIFEEFKQLGDESRTRGSGLGLTIVAKTADLLGLELRVKSRPNRGSLFAIEMPQGRAKHTRTHVESAHEQRHARVALVDDNPIVLNALALALKEAGHDVVAASSAQELLSLLERRSPDIMICDYRLSGETGYDVIKKVRTAFSSKLPAIIITGDTDPELMRSMAEHGIIIQYKPLEFDVLQMRIEEAVGKSAVGAAG